MAGTAKVSDQTKMIGNRFDISNHTFLNQLTTGMQVRVGETVPGLKVTPVGKKASQGEVSLTLMGQVALDDATKVEDAEDKVRQLMDSLKNPSNLLMLLGG